MAYKLQDKISFSRSQAKTEACKRWYGDWQVDLLHGVQRTKDVDSFAGIRTASPRQVGGVATFTGASGPTGTGGSPLRLHHGTFDDITTFDLKHPNRKDQ